MCLTIPKKVIEIKKESVILENPSGDRQEVKSIVETKVGDYVLTQQNVIIQKLEKKDAEEIIKLIQK